MRKLLLLFCTIPLFTLYSQAQTDVINIIPSGNVGISSTAPVSSLEVAGSYGQKVTALTANTVLNATHNTLVCDPTAGSFIVTLPAASVCTGRVYVIKRNATVTANTVTIAGGATIDGAASFVLNSPNQVIEVFSDGSEWKTTVGGASGLTTLTAGNDIDFGTSSAPNSIDIEPVLNFVHTVSAPASNNLNLNAASGFATVVNYNNGTTGTNQTFRIGNGAGGSDVFYVYADGQAFTTNWWRSLGSNGWYNQTWGGGIFMDNGTHVKTYGAKDFYIVGTGNTLRMDGIKSGQTYNSSTTAASSNLLYANNSTGDIYSLPTVNSATLVTGATGIPSWVASTGTGVQGYWTRSGTLLYNTNQADNVGIATTAPVQRLEVNGKTIIHNGGTTYNNGGAGELHVGYGFATGGTVGEVARLALQPYGHTGGPFIFYNRDDASNAYLDLRYGTTPSFFTLANNGNVGISSANPGQKLDVAGNIKLGDNMMVEGNSAYRVYRNLVTYNNSTSAAAGAFVINTNQAWNSACMFRVKVEGYFYDATSPFETTIGGYMYTGNDFYNYGYINVGARNLSVRFARNISTNTVAIILGDEAASYSYPKLSVTSYMQGHSTPNESYADGWSMAQITSLAGYDYVVSVPNVTTLPTGSGNYIQNQITGAQATSNFWLSNTGRAAAFQLNDANTSLTEGSGDALRIGTTTGYIDIGSQNSSWAHMQTDRPRYYFNKGVTVDEGLIGSYDEDLQLQTQGTTRITALNSNGNVGIGTTVPGQKLEVGGNIKLDDNMMVEGTSSARVYRNLATYSSNVSASPGVFIINTNQPFAIDCMFRVKIEGYFYDASATFETTVGAYNYNGGSTFLNKGYTNIGAKNLPVRLGRNASGNVAIILGTDNATYEYPKISVTSYHQGYGGINEAYADGWTITRAADASALTLVTTVPDVTTLPTGSGNYIQNQVAANQAAGFRITGNGLFNGGSVGINTTAPATLLNVNLGAGDATVGTAAIRVGGTSNYASLELGIKGGYDGMISTFGNDLHIYAGNWRTAGATATENHSISFYTSQASSTNWNTAKMILTAAGNLGIGSTAPTQKLTVAGNINKSGSWIAGDAVWGANFFEVHNNSWDGVSNGNYGGIIGGHMYSYGGIDIGTGGGNEAAGGQLVAATDIKTPIYYDRNDVSYYVDPNGNSIINTVRVAGGSPAAGKVLTSTDGAGNATWQYPSNAWEYVGTDARAACNGGAADLVYEWGVTYNNVGNILRVTCNTWNVGYRVCTYPPYPTGDSEPFRWGGACFIWGTNSTWDDACSRYYHSYYYQNDEGKYEMLGGGCDNNPTVYRRKL